MSKYPTALTLTIEDRSTLASWVRAGKTERRLAERARMVLAAANGQGTIAIARAQRRRAASVSKWRVRFSQAGLTGLQDAPRP
ncbi:MAG: IS630 family transposase, partial [Candidatus Korobacteraceae bacterium]